MAFDRFVDGIITAGGHIMDAMYPSETRLMFYGHRRVI